MMIFALFAKMMVCSGILYGYYWLFLRNKKFHHYNRFYLLAATALSIPIPFIKIPILFETETTTGQIVYQSMDIISVSRWEDEFVENSTTNILSNYFNLQTVLIVLYAVGICVLLYMLGCSFMYIRNITKKYSFKIINRLKFYNTSEPGTPFSYFKTIFWNVRLDLNSSEGQQIFRHELFHVNQRHSVDILFLECVRILFWVNPFFHLIKKELKAIHEFLADQHAVSDNNQHDYAELLILQTINAKKSTIANYFFQNHIKRRITMITQLKTKKYTYSSRLLVLPLALLLFCAIALYSQNGRPSAVKKEWNGSEWERATESITVLVDAGHGGKDAGAHNDAGLQEKDLALSIARQIKENASAYNINVIMTRETDVFPTLKERTELAKTVKADLIISVHVAASHPSNLTKNGFDIYITNKNQQTHGQSKLLAQHISTQINTLYTVSPIKQRKENGIWILDAVTCPAVLIECGYITNDADLAFISKIENQEKIAKSILKGIVDYQSTEKNVYTPKVDKTVSNIYDTIPASQQAKDKKVDSDQLHQDRIIQLQHEKQLRILKMQQIESDRQKLVEARNGEIENKKQFQMQKKQEMELDHQKIALQESKLQKEKQLMMVKQQEMELLRQRSNEDRNAQNKKSTEAQEELQLDVKPGMNKSETRGNKTNTKERGMDDAGQKEEKQKTKEEQQ